MTTPPPTDRPIGRRPLLEGLRVLDLSLWQPGHTATQLFADLGAEVLKVEPPGGDRMRWQIDRFANFNRHKRSVVIDLKTADGRAKVLQLAADADVVVENYRPGLADRLGVGFDDLRAVNPAIVMCSITGYGQEGPLAHVPGHDFNYQAYAGAFTFPAGQPPAHAVPLIGDQGGATAAAFAMLAAVWCAQRTGEGEHIDLAIADVLAAWVAPVSQVHPGRGPTIDLSRIPGMGVFATSDGKWIELGVFSEDRLWDELVRGLGFDEFAGMTMEARTADAPALRAAIAERIAARTRDDLVADLTARGVPISPILTRDEMLEHPNFHARGVITADDDGCRIVGHPIRYREHPVLGGGRAPELGAHDGWSTGGRSTER